MAEILANPTPADIDLAKPDLVDNVKLDAWYMDDSDEDQRFPHRYVTTQSFHEPGLTTGNLATDFMFFVL